MWVVCLAEWRTLLFEERSYVNDGLLTTLGFGSAECRGRAATFPRLHLATNRLSPPDTSSVPAAAARASPFSTQPRALMDISPHTIVRTCRPRVRVKHEARDLQDFHLNNWSHSRFRCKKWDHKTHAEWRNVADPVHTHLTLRIIFTARSWYAFRSRLMIYLATYTWLYNGGYSLAIISLVQNLQTMLISNRLGNNGQIKQLTHTALLILCKLSILGTGCSDNVGMYFSCTLHVPSKKSLTSSVLNE